jgi:hypothetical protein
MRCRCISSAFAVQAIPPAISLLATGQKKCVPRAKTDAIMDDSLLPHMRLMAMLQVPALMTI